MIIKAISDATVIAINRKVCQVGGNTHAILKPHGAGSAVSTAFYPGSPIYVHGGVAGIAGALCFYLCTSHVFQDGNKRTGMDAALLVLWINGWDLQYPKTTATSALADLAEQLARNEKSKEDAMVWFDRHKVPRQ